MFDPQAMDDAAHEAELDLLGDHEGGEDGVTQLANYQGVDDIARWWSKWFLKAGHKRLGRILVGIAKEVKE